ncbi:MAG: hypothetical protein L3K26_07795 [Candidatus Hydrogenedentes bacterium]|nr:hypothetical protein [Candidatus Hydrogenedentota bacterium]
MNAFIRKFSGIVKGTLTGFDRIVFKGSILPLMYDEGVKSFCRGRGILNKDYKSWMLKQTGKLIDSATQYAETRYDKGITHIASSRTRKEELARQRQQKMNIDRGLIGVWSAVESCRSYKAKYCAKSGFPQLRGEWSKCKHLYFYFDHEDFGFMNIRLQTWFPYHIQLCLNGREWLRRSLERENIDFVAKGNKFLHIADYEVAQRMLDSQLDTRWAKTMDGFLPTVFPAMEQILGPHLSYYWTLWQSEWATDLIFPSSKDLSPITNTLLRHAFMTGNSTAILRYLDRPITKAGKPHANMNNDVTSRILDFNDGVRVRHWVDHNSVKIYNEGNTLRVETTMNQPSMFKVHRHAQGESEDTPKRRLPLRKGVADIAIRAQVSQDINNRLMEQLATCSSEKPVHKLLDDICKTWKQDGRRVRALDPTGKDRALLKAISDPVYCISAISNKPLREKLSGYDEYKNMTDKQRSAKISRQLRLLRDHGLIKKLPKQRKYQLTQKGRELTSTLNALLTASTQQLMNMAA